MSLRFDAETIKRIVIKVGSSSIVNVDGEVRLGFLGQLVTVISRLQGSGKQVVLVTSGAVSMGYTRLGFAKRPTDIPSRQACAAAGQTELMALYQKLFGTHGLKSAQVLVTRDDIEDRRRYLNARDALEQLLNLGLVPVVNENDSVAVDEIQYGDNDLISALIAGIVDADLLVLLTDVDGLYDEDLADDGEPKIIPLLEGPLNGTITGVTDKPRRLGSGGMRSKLEAADLCRQYGIHAVIARSSGRRLPKIIAGEEVGTYIRPDKSRINSRRRWLFKAAAIQGSVVLDAGAAQAVTQRQKSLLPGGVKAVSGIFLRGSVIQLQDEQGLKLARGISRYKSEDLEKILGHRSDEIEQLLGYTFGDEVVHRDGLVLEMLEEN